MPFQFVFLTLMGLYLAPAAQSLEATLAGFLPEPMHGLTAAFDGEDSILLFGAAPVPRRKSQETKIYKYNINTEVVEEVGGLPFSRRYMGAVGIDRHRNIYYIGGNDGDYSSYYNVLKFNSDHPNPVEVADLPISLNQFSSASDIEGDAIYTFGGWIGNSSTTHILKFNTRENVVEEFGDLPESLYGSAAVWHKGFAYIMGGTNSDTRTSLTHVLQFDPSRNKTTELEIKDAKVKEVFLPTMVSDGQCVYLIGGHTRDKTGTHQMTQLDVEAKMLREVEVTNFPTNLAWSTSVYVPKKRAIYTFGGILGTTYKTTDRIYKINLS